MALYSKLPYVLLLLCAVLAVASHAASLPLVPQQAADGASCPVPQNRCSVECERRCSATSHKKPCLLFCNKCCNTCLCVPTGTYGNKECCSCYNNWKTQEGKPKCP